jgi:ribonuclease-3
MNRAPLEVRLGYSFSRPELLDQALTHRSYGSSHNERLEFLGDGVLNCAVAAVLYGRFAGLSEGELSRLRASLVRQDSLHKVAKLLALADWLNLGEGERKSGGLQRPSILADAVEGIIGAVFLDGGYEAAESVILRIFQPLIERLDPKSPRKDSKTTLQEVLQARKIDLPKYAVVACRGAAHSRVFEVECVISELGIRTTGSGATRRLAEQDAAVRAFAVLRK